MDSFSGRSHRALGYEATDWVARASYSIANLSTSIQSRLSSRFDRLLPLLCAISAKPVSTIVRVVVTLIRAFGHRTTLLNTLKWPPFVFLEEDDNPSLRCDNLAFSVVEVFRNRGAGLRDVCGSES